MATDAHTQAENLVTFIEKQRDIIKEAQEGYRRAQTHQEKVKVMKDFLTKKAALQGSLPHRESQCLFSIGTGTATVATAITTVAV
jgi:hypothetical protein